MCSREISPAILYISLSKFAQRKSLNGTVGVLFHSLCQSCLQGMLLSHSYLPSVGLPIGHAVRGLCGYAFMRICGYERSGLGQAVSCSSGG